MGTLRSFSSAAQGLIVNDIMLGQPVENEGEFFWDHPLLPNGVIDEEGNVEVDE